ncbi:amidohydrolase family protein, partial [Candidatus Bathyarchaeota archaeon]|nr:amidohydrolase family protein [Candidatus Bathyarchaeota archaeon]
MYDIIIRNGKIVDGTGNPWFFADVAVKDGKIDKISKKVLSEAETVIDATGLVVCPGFIDAHSHAERMLLFYPLAQSHIMQGITTFVGGQCGGSPAPIAEKMGLPGLLSDYMMEFAPYKYRPETRKFPFEQVNEWMK